MTEAAQSLNYERAEGWLPVLSTMAASVVGVAAWFGDASGPYEAALTLQPRVDERISYFHRQEATAATVRTNEDQLDALEQLFVTRDTAELRIFLSSRPELVSLIVEAFVSGSQFFPKSPAILELVKEHESDRVGVAMFFTTSTTSDAAMQRLEEFDAAWWLANMTRAQGLLSIAVEFV